MNSENAIEISGLKKMYKLGQIGGGTLQGDLQSWWARVRGREDPNSKIGSDQRSNGKTFMALNGIDLTVRKGEALGIIGHNGAGKSTLLKLLSRVTAPTEGTIDINGRIASMLEVGTGFNGEMTGRENVYMNGAILGMTKAEVDAKMEQIIEFSEVREFIDTPVKRYSSGMYVKLAFSVAAHLDSEIMIMDEVLAVGDMAFQKKCLDKMRQAANQEGRTVLYVSHNMNTIRQLCERCVVLDKGKVIFEGDTEEAISVYLSDSCDENETKINFDLKSHVDRQCNNDVQMKHLELCDKVVPIYFNEENMQLRFFIRVNKPVENMAFRMTLRTDNDILVGTAWSEKMNISEIGDTELVFIFNLSGLSKGRYSASIGFYSIEPSGAATMLDHVIRAFMFQVEEKPQYDGLVWHPAYWGYAKLPMIKRVKD